MSDAFNSVKSAIKTAVAEIDKQIKALSAQRVKLLAAVESPNTNTAATLVKSSATKNTKAKGTKGPGMLNVLLPFMEGKGPMKAAELLKYLHTHGYPQVKANSVYATIANELKKPNSRLEKVADGEYRVSAAYFARPVENTPAAETDQPVEATA